MEQVRKIGIPRTTGPVDLQLILNSTVSVKVKLQLIQKISDSLEVILNVFNTDSL